VVGRTKRVLMALTSYYL